MVATADQRTGERSACLSCQASSTLLLGEATPDSMRLSDGQCVFQAFLDDRAGIADHLCASFTIDLLFLLFEMSRCKEEECLWSATCSVRLPQVSWCSFVKGHLHSPKSGWDDLASTYALLLFKQAFEQRKSNRKVAEVTLSDQQNLCNYINCYYCNFPKFPKLLDQTPKSLLLHLLHL